MEVDYKNKKRILIGIILVLILINLTALGTLGYQKYKRNHNRQNNWQPTKKPIENKNERIKKFVKEELKLNDKQCSIYFRSMDENFALSEQMMAKIRNCKKQILEQTISGNPDTIKIDQLCDSLGLYHAKMQRGMNRHFLFVMTNLDTAQQAKLKRILIRMSDKDWDRVDNSRNRGDKAGKPNQKLH